MNVRMLVPNWRVLALAIPVTMLAGVPAFIGYRIAVADHTYTTTAAAEKGKEAEVVVHHFSYVQTPSFWLPLAVFAALVVVTAAMLFVSHDRSKLVPGAAVGVAVVAAAAFCAVKFLPSHIDGASVWRGAVCGMAAIFAVGLVALGMHLAHNMPRN